MVVFRALRVYHIIVDNALSRTGLPDLQYALNPYLGCSHGCVYCYARLYTRDKRASLNWGKVVVVKTNIARALEREITKYKSGEVGVGTITDPYQPVEAHYKLTRSCIEILLRHGFSVSIQTKNPLVLRDIDVFERYKQMINIGLTITTLNSRTASFIEPGSPPPVARAETLRKLSEKGIKTWLFYGPIIPGLNDDDSTILSIIKLAYETRSLLYYDSLHVKPFMKRLDYALYEYTARVNRSWWTSIVDKITDLCHEYGLVCRPGFTGG